MEYSEHDASRMSQKSALRPLMYGAANARIEPKPTSAPFLTPAVIYGLASLNGYSHMHNIGNMLDSCNGFGSVLLGSETMECFNFNRHNSKYETMSSGTSKMNFQLGILSGIPDHGRYIELRAQPGAKVTALLQSLELDERMIVGLGPSLVLGIGKVDGLHTFQAISGKGIEVPSTQADLWIWLRGEDRGEIAKRARQVLRSLQAGFTVVRMVDGFKYGVDLKIGRDLSGYEDGTENPQDEAAIAAAFASDGSSFVSVQQWEHDLNQFDDLHIAERNNIVGRQISDNEEMETAPESAHVKRTAQESFEPEAFVLRRSMPWADGGKEGLVFVAFGHSLNAFEALLNRMVGLEDGIVDGLFQFTRPVSGANYWCPPTKNGHLDLSKAGL